MVDRAICNAKAHGIGVHLGVQNLANGNCAFETILDSINTRDCFIDSFDGTPDFWRTTWMTEVETVAFDDWNGGLSKAQWHEEWEVLKQSGTYEYQLGDLVIPGIAHCTKKDILIFNTNTNAHYPVYVIKASMLCNQTADNEIPICLAYNSSHYEALVPDTDEDIMRTILLKQEIIDGTYSLKMTDVFAINELQERKESPNTFTYAKAVKRNINQNSQK